MKVAVDDSKTEAMLSSADAWTPASSTVRAPTKLAAAASFGDADHEMATLVAEDADLFAYRGPAPTDESKQDAFKVYEHLRDSDWCIHHRQYVRRLWKRFHALGLNDPSFATHFPFECPARIWEMRLACILNSWDWRLVPSPKPGAGPDFGIHMSNPVGRTMWVEATAPSAGTGSNRTGFFDAGQGHRMAYGKELQRTQSEPSATPG